MSVWVNGRRNARLDAADRGLQYGDGLFETMRVRRRQIRLLDFHLDRLADGCGRLGLTPLEPKRLRRELERVAARRSEGVLKLIVTRGVGPRGYRPSGRERATRVVSLHGLPGGVVPALTKPVHVRLCSTRLGISCSLAGLKTLNRLESVVARSEWADPRIWEGLMQDTDGHLVCGTMSNLFVRRGTILMTPMLDRCGIVGVMRRWVLEQATGLALRAVEERLHWDDLAQADEVFLTNAIAGIVSVASVKDGTRRIRPESHATSQILRHRLERW